MKLNGSRTEMVNLVRSEIPARFPVHLAFGKVRITVLCDGENLARTLSEYFEGFTTEAADPEIFITVHQSAEPRISIPLVVKAPDPGKDKEKEAFADIPGGRIVKKVLTGMVFIFGENEHVAVGPCMENPNQVVNFILNRVISNHLDKGSLLAHAAGVCGQDGKGIILAGFSGRGKSTLALHLLNSGLNFVSNDRLLIAKTPGGLEMHGIAKLPRINPGTVLSVPGLSFLLGEDERARLLSYSPEALWCLERKYDVPVNEVYGKGRFVLNAKPCGVVVLNWRFGAPGFIGTRVDLPARPDVVEVIAKEPGLFHLAPPSPRGSALSGYAELLADIPVVEISGGVDFTKAVFLVRTMLDKAS